MKHRSDNQAVPLVLTSGSKKLHIHKLVLDIVDFCVKNSINLIPEWVPRDLNIISDFASKNVVLSTQGRLPDSTVAGLIHVQRESMHLLLHGKMRIIVFFLPLS